jgi:hypothetical protein
MSQDQVAPEAKTDSWGGLTPTSTHEPQTAWGRMLKKLCECHVFVGTWANDAEAWATPDTHESYCPADIADKFRDEIRTQFDGEDH